MRAAFLALILSADLIASAVAAPSAQAEVAVRGPAFELPAASVVFPHAQVELAHVSGKLQQAGKLPHAGGQLLQSGGQLPQSDGQLPYAGGQLLGAAPAAAPALQVAQAQLPSVRDAADQAPAPAQAATAADAADAAVAGEPNWRHASSLTDQPRQPPGFGHFGYVNPDAPKGGQVRLASEAGFDSFNPVLTRGIPAPGLNLIYDTLMHPADDEQDISGAYGLIAEAVRYPDDFAWVEYRVDPAARWHDGTPITADDVAWSLGAAKGASANLAFYFRDVERAEVVAERTVRFTFSRPGNRELPHIVGQLTVLPKAWWTGSGPGGPRDIMAGTLEPPLASGPYRVARFEANRFVEYAREPNYWAKDHPTQVGANNFDTIRYDVYRDSTVVVEAFKADNFDFRTENSAKNWATGYEIPALARGDIVKEVFPVRGTGLMQAFVMNLRLDKFSDARVRRALNLMYDFETQKRTIFFGQYDRISSYFMGTELASTGLPQGAELDVLESVRDLVPPAVFTTPYANPVNLTPTDARENARRAIALFAEAGYEIRSGRMVNVATGEPFTIEYTDDSPVTERYVLPYASSLRRIGVTLTSRTIDSSQFQNKLAERDFEMATLAWGQSLSPGNEQQYYWGSAAADQPQSQNYAGIKDAGVDALIERVILAKDRAGLIAATRALDRVLLAHDYVVPLFYLGSLRTVRWNRFGHPDNIPPFSTSFPTIWWWDAGKAATIGSPS